MTFRGLLLIALLCLTPALLRANSDERDWKLVDGRAFRAELVSYDEAKSEVVLRFRDTESRTYRFDEFGVVDQAWLAEWLEIDEDMDAILKLLGGRLEHLTTVGTYPTDLFVYYPSRYLDKATRGPALILFHPGGKAGRYVKRHMEAAEASGMILVACGTFHNTRDDAVDAQLFERFKEVFPQILERVRLDPLRLFMGGISGGAARAYHYTAQVQHPWAGVFANGGWLGNEYDQPYPAGMRVAMVNGNLDKAANHYVEPDGKCLRDRGSDVGVFSFEGGHQVPPPLTQMKVFDWLLDQSDSALKSATPVVAP